MIILSRNNPIAFVVGVAGFLGSHLAENLLEKGIQVVGVDNLSTGHQENLREVARDKNFHFINQSGTESLPFEFPRLDYAFFAISENGPSETYNKSFENFLKIGQPLNPKIVLISSIELYDLKKEGLENLKEAEGKLALYAKEHPANARVVRLSAVFGPRMHFRGNDPILRLLKAAAQDDLQEGVAPLDFTTRSLYLADAVNLLIKAVMHGATAQKIYDGALLNPVKVAEIRQVLLDPLWHERKGFTPTELPPWPTPNLLKTEKELIWKPKISLVKALKETLSFLRGNPDWAKEEMEPEKLVEDQVVQETEKSKPVKFEPVKKVKKEKIKPFKNYAVALVSLLLVTYAFIYPGIKLAFGVFEVRTHLRGGVEAFSLGNLARAEKEIGEAQKGAGEIRGVLGPVGIFSQTIKQGSEIPASLVAAVSFSLEAAKNLEEVLGMVTAGREGGEEEKIEEASLNLAQAEKKLNDLYHVASDTRLRPLIPLFYPKGTEELKKNLTSYQKNLEKSKIFLELLPELAALGGQKNYLFLLEDNTRLLPGGGEVKAWAQVSFKEGKLVGVEVKEDNFRDSNPEPDFPTNAQHLQRLYQEQTGTATKGVVAFDFLAVSSLLKTLGPISLSGEREEISGENLIPKILALEGKEKFSKEVFEEFLNKLFFLSKPNWFSLVQVLNKNLSEKHLLVYLSDPGLSSYLQRLGWTGSFPWPAQTKKGEREEFLSFSETETLDNRAGFNLKKRIDLSTTIKNNREVTHKLVVSFANQTKDKLWGNQLKIYLASGSKLTKASLGKEDVLNKISSFSDWGRAGYKLALEIKPQEEKSLILEYQDLAPLEFDENQVKYRLEVVKQPSSQGDSFNFKLFYPSSYKLISSDGIQSIPQEVSFASDLVEDRVFEVLLAK